MRAVVFALISVALATLATPALATDGVLEINQACATAVEGCFTGDAAGFPVTLGLPGSYRLTGNLSSPLNVTAIDITADNVTLDLGGFLISSTNVCTGYPTASCTINFGNPGITSNAQTTTVRNGTVQGMAGIGVFLSGAFAEVSQLRVILCGSDGISVGDTSRVVASMVHGNRSQGIKFSAGGSAQDNLVRANGGIGIWGSGQRLGDEVVGNRIYDNGGNGIVLDNLKSLVSKNVLTDNVGVMAGGVSLGDNVCGTTLC